MRPYLVLLRAGFCLPPVLPRARCALTAPFHPYPPSRSALRRASLVERASFGLAITGFTRRSAKREGGRYIFCATVLQVTLTGRYPAHCPAEFGLSSYLSASDHLSRCDGRLYNGQERQDGRERQEHIQPVLPVQPILPIRLFPGR